MSEQRPVGPRGLNSAIDAEEFSFAEAVGGWRGFAESVAPGVVFVVCFLIWGGFEVPTLASVGTVAVLVVVRLIQRTPVQQALSGVVGVGLGAIWAWRSGEASGYFLPGLWINAAYLLGTVVSMIVRWPVAGVAIGLIRGVGSAWRADPVAMRRLQQATAVLAAMFALRLAVQVPLYLADQVAALGTARLSMGVPLFALTLWTVWLMGRNAAQPAVLSDPPPPER